MTIAILDVGFKTDIGRKRSSNQDSYAVLRRPELDNLLDGLIVVADGMGGVGGGEIASGIVAQTMPAATRDLLSEWTTHGEAIDAGHLLREVMGQANKNVIARQETQPGLRGMGTTCVAGVLLNGVMTIGNVGDSRAYLMRKGHLLQVTEDHSEVWAQVKAGNMTREQARTNRYRNVITQAIGIQGEISPDIDVVRLEEGDSILFCSDGLSTELTDNEIAAVLASEPDAQEACDSLVRMALKNGGSDNVTVAVLRYGAFAPYPPSIEEEEEPAHYERAPRDRQEEDTWEEAPSWPKPVREKTRRSGVSPWLPAILAIIAIAEGIGLIGLWREKQHREAVRPPPPIPPRTAFALFYGKPKLLLPQALLDNYLLVEPGGTLIVVEPDRTVLRVSIGGRAAPLPLSLPVSAVAGAGTSPKIKPIYMTEDASGNRYQTNSSTKAIDKFNLAGTRIMENIGKGALSAPASIGVDTSGNLYVIDNHHLKQIPASVNADSEPPAPIPVHPTEQNNP